MRALDLMIELATSPGFDTLFDPVKGTPLIEPYHDDAGYPTIGYGHLLSRKRWAPLDRWPAITLEEADALLRADAIKHLSAAQRLCPVALTDGQIAALGDFAFNVGAGNLEISTLRKCVLRGDHVQAQKEFGKWVFADRPPVKMRGLVRRRAAEAALYAT
jgi:lysozyme